MREIFSKDISWKVFSLALAIIIWVTIRTAVSKGTSSPSRPWESAEKRSFTDLPVLVVSAAADVRESRVSPKTVDVIVSATEEVLAALQPKDIRVSVDLTEIESARSLQKRVDVSTPAGVTLITVTPSEVNVTVPKQTSPTQ